MEFLKIKEEKSPDESHLSLKTSVVLSPSILARYEGYQLVSCVPITDQHTRSKWLQEYNVPVNYCYYLIKK